jgi:hypothetical protein
MRPFFAILIGAAGVGAVTALLMAFSPYQTPLSRPVSAAMTSGDGIAPIAAANGGHGFVLETAEGAGPGDAIASVVTTSDGETTVVQYPEGAEWRQRAGLTRWTSAESGYAEEIRLADGLPRWLVMGLYPSTRANLQEIVETRPGVGGRGPYVDWAGVEAAVASGKASWLPPAAVCGHRATGIRIPRRNVYPGLDGGEYRVWFDRARRLRLQREEIVDDVVIHGLWCRRYDTGGNVSTTLARYGATDPGLPHSVVEVRPVPVDRAGPLPLGTRPARAFRVSRTWTGTPPERMLPAGAMTVFLLESPGESPGYVLSVEPPGHAPLRMEWLHDARPFSFGRDAAAAAAAPSLLGTWSSDSGLQGGVWFAGGRQWVFVGPGKMLGDLAAALRGS